MADARFDDLRKLPDHPAARILSQNRVKLQTPVEAPASAHVSTVLAELHGKGAVVDMLQLLAHTLPPREAAWWACLAARDLGGGPTKALRSAEAWVRQPGFETRLAAREALDAAPNDDDTAFCAMAASFADGTLGPGEYDDYEAPHGAVGCAVFGMILIALFADEERVEERGALLLSRALDIARGGSGQVEPNPARGALTGETTQPAAPDDRAAS